MEEDLGRYKGEKFMYRGMSKRLILLVMIGSMGMTTIAELQKLKKKKVFM